MRTAFIVMILGSLLLWAEMNYSRHDLDVGQTIGRTIVEKLIIDHADMTHQEKQRILAYVYGEKP